MRDTRHPSAHFSCGASLTKFVFGEQQVESVFGTGRYGWEKRQSKRFSQDCQMAADKLCINDCSLRQRTNLMAQPAATYPQSEHSRSSRKHSFDMGTLIKRKQPRICPPTAQLYHACATLAATKPPAVPAAMTAVRATAVHPGVNN